MNIDFYIDELLEKCPQNLGFNCYNILKDIQGFSKSNITSEEVREKLITLKYVEKKGNLPVILTPLGLEVINSGGHLKYQALQNQKEKRSETKEHYDYVNSITDAKTKWIIVLTTIIGVLVAVLTLK